MSSSVVYELKLSFTRLQLTGHHRIGKYLPSKPIPEFIEVQQELYLPIVPLNVLLNRGSKFDQDRLASRGRGISYEDC